MLKKRCIWDFILFHGAVITIVRQPQGLAALFVLGSTFSFFSLGRRPLFLKVDINRGECKLM